MTAPDEHAILRLRREREELRARLAEIDAELGEGGESHSRELLASLLDEIEVGILSFSTDKRCVTYTNPAMLQIFGQPRSAFDGVGLALTRWIHHEDLGRFLNAQRTLFRGAVAEAEGRIVRPNGEVRTVRGRALPVPNSRGDVVRIDAMFVDITELARVNAELEHRVSERTAELRDANEALTRASRAKDEFLASMSHELRTPLNAVLGLSEALQEAVYGQVTDKQRQALERIEHSGRHLLGLIGDILDLSKIEAGKMTLEIGQVQINEVCRASLAMIEETAQKKELTVSLQIRDGFSSLPADERKLKQVLVNLLANAAKFTPDRGSIGLDVAAADDGVSVRFTVWDSGVGIAREDLGRLFQPFVQVDATLTRSHTGTGLGLALVRRLVEMHGGRVEVESIPGQGSRFSVVLPRRRAEPTPTRGLAATPRALIIEDSAPVAEQLSRYLREVGIEAIIHDQRDGAIDRAALEQPEVILLDILLPAEVGWQILRELKDDPRTCDIPVIVISVLDRPDRARSLGADDLLVKPVSRGQLHAAIAKLSDGRGVSRPVLIIDPATPQNEPFATRILLAEDDELNIATLIDFLRAKGHEVFVARDGSEAVTLTREIKPDLVLMDIQMPVLDGLAAMREIKADPSPEVRAIPIVAVTALVMTGDRERCLEAGALEYIAKPVSLKRIASVLERLLGRR